MFELCQDLIWLLSIQDLVMDILRVLSSPDLEVRKKTLQLALDLVSSRNVEEVSNMHSISIFFADILLSMHGHKYKWNLYLFSSWLLF